MARNMRPAAYISTFLWYSILPELVLWKNSGALKALVPTSDDMHDVISSGSRNLLRSKSDNLTRMGIIRGNKNVSRFDVSVDDVVAVKVFYTSCYLFHHF